MLFPNIMRVWYVQLDADAAPAATVLTAPTPVSTAAPRDQPCHRPLHLRHRDPLSVGCTRRCPASSETRFDLRQTALGGRLRCAKRTVPM